MRSPLIIELTLFTGKLLDTRLDNSNEFVHIRDQRRSFMVAAAFLINGSAAPLLLNITEAGQMSYQSLATLCAGGSFSMHPSPLTPHIDAGSLVHAVSAKGVDVRGLFRQWRLKTAAAKESKDDVVTSRSSRSTSLLDVDVTSFFFNKIENLVSTREPTDLLMVTDRNSHINIYALFSEDLALVHRSQEGGEFLPSYQAPLPAPPAPLPP